MRPPGQIGRGSVRHEAPALLIIDLQSALCTGDSAAFDIERVIERINDLAAKARAAGVPVVLIQHEEDAGPLRCGTEGWQLDARLMVRPEDIRVRKTATDSFHRTELHELLQSRGVSDLVVCGLQSEFCVDSTVRGALAHGYPVTLVADGHSTLDNGILSAARISAHHTATLANIGSFGPRVTATAAAEIHFEAQAFIPADPA
jgi:nicotinamidase-related amidase